jgi:hypothetical protein
MILPAMITLICDGCNYDENFELDTLSSFLDDFDKEFGITTMDFGFDRKDAEAKGWFFDDIASCQYCIDCRRAIEDN